VMMSGHGTIDTAVEATRIGAQDFLEKPIALQKLLSSVKRALLKAATPTARPELTLAAFTRAAPLRDLKKRLDQVSAKSRALLLKSGSGSLAELCARTLQTPGKAWLDLAHHGQPLALEALEQAAVDLGLTPEQGRQLAVGTVQGAAALAAQSPEPASVLRERVTSKGGTTAAALAVMSEQGVREGIVAGVRAAEARGRELGRLLGAN